MARSLFLAALALIAISEVSAAADTPAPFTFPYARLSVIAADGSYVEAYPVTFTAVAPDFKTQLDKMDARSRSKLNPLITRQRFFLDVDGSQGEMTVRNIQAGRSPGTAGGAVCPLTAFWLTAIDSKGTVPRITVQGAEPVTFKVADAELRKRLKELGEGSVVQLEGTTTGCVWTATRATVKVAELPGEGKIGVALLVAGVVLVGAVFFFNPGTRNFLVGKDGRYSSSKFQMAVWFSVFLVSYFVFFYLRFTYGALVGGISIPTNLLLMSGLSALTFVGAKAITQGNANQADAKAEQARREADLAATAAAGASNAAAQAAAAGALNATTMAQMAVEQTSRAVTAMNNAATLQGAANNFKGAAGMPQFWRDLLYGDDGKPSFSKLQLVVVTLLAAAVYVFRASQLVQDVPLQGLVTLPDVDSALLTAFGLGQGAYLGIKLTGE